MLGDSGTFSNSERLYRANNQNFMFPPPPPFAQNNPNFMFPPPPPFAQNNQNHMFPPHPPFAGFQLPPHRPPMNVHNFETSPLLEERKQRLPTGEAFYYAQQQQQQQQQAFNAQTHRPPMMVHSNEISPPLENRNRMFPTEAFNYAHQQAFNSLTSSMLEGDTLHGNVSTTGGDQVNEISNQHALQQQQQQQQQEEAHESEEELPWEEQMALALEPTPLR